MKGSVRSGKWVEVKGKFRASYLLSQALVGILKIEISNTIMLNLRLSLIKDRKTSKIQNGFLVFFCVLGESDML